MINIYKASKGLTIIIEFYIISFGNELPRYHSKVFSD